eukprot:scaffold24204_cov84-Isochrysis_galbana.AAC.2
MTLIIPGAAWLLQKAPRVSPGVLNDGCDVQSSALQWVCLTSTIPGVAWRLQKARVSPGVLKTDRDVQSSAWQRVGMVRCFPGDVDADPI